MQSREVLKIILFFNTRLYMILFFYVFLLYLQKEKNKNGDLKLYLNYLFKFN